MFYEDEIKEIDVKQVLDHVSKGAYLLDVRDQYAFDDRHVEGSIRLTEESFGKLMIKINYDTELLIICEKGISSKKTAEYLAGIGYDNVYNVTGGIRQWVEEGLPVVSTNK